MICTRFATLIGFCNMSVFSHFTFFHIYTYMLFVRLFKIVLLSETNIRLLIMRVFFTIIVLILFALSTSLTKPYAKQSFSVHFRFRPEVLKYRESSPFRVSVFIPSVFLVKGVGRWALMYVEKS